MRLFTDRVYQIPVKDTDRHATNTSVIAPQPI
ncbi:hypothetical protein C8R11_1307 [Nitrosomonas aestuarii]|nr:hypothetical protein C8R11_1307 [Nitrosomonas aestuarii]